MEKIIIKSFDGFEISAALFKVENPKAVVQLVHGCVPHAIVGYEYLMGLNYDEEYAAVCLTHSYLNNDINCVAGGIPSTDRYRYDFVKNFVATHQYTECEKLINLCDLMCTDKVLTLEKRLLGLIVKHGVFENTVYHIKEAQKLKAYFDDKLGYNIYKLFPNIELN